MNELSIGSVTVRLPDGSPVSAKAGNLSKEEVLRLAKAQTGIATACEDSADAIGLAGPSFVLPEGVTPDTLRQAAQRSRDLEKAIAEVEHTHKVLKQARLLECALALALVGQVNDQVKAQGKRQPRLLSLFKRIVSYFQKNRPKKTAPVSSEVPAPGALLSAA